MCCCSYLGPHLWIAQRNFPEPLKKEFMELKHGNQNMISSDRRISFIWNAVKIFFSIALVGYFLSWVKISDVLSVWERIQLPYVYATLILYIVLTLFKAYKYQVLLQQKTNYFRVMNIVIVQNSLSNFFTNSAGIASYLALFRFEENVKIRQSGLVFVIIKLGDLFSVWLVSIVCSWLVWDRISPLRNVIIAALIAIGVGFIVFFFALFWRRGFISLANRIMVAMHLTKYNFFQNVVNALTAFSEMQQDVVYGIVLKAFGLSFLYYLVTLAWMLVSMRAFQLPADNLSILFVSGILQLFSMIPVTVLGGIGITEVTSLYLYSLFGVAQTDLSVVLVGWRIFYYVTNLLLVLYLPIYALFIEPKIPSK
jgi:uncharacterized membrane protein YbhN (UPF0104 family)